MDKNILVPILRDKYIPDITKRLFEKILKSKCKKIALIGFSEHLRWLNRLLKEVNVVTILLLALYFCIERLNNHPYYGFKYLAGTIDFVFLDAVKKKGRHFMLGILLLLCGLFFYLMYEFMF